MEADTAAVAAVIADPTRSVMLDALMTGEALTAGELARAASIAPSTASEHLRRLREVGLVDVYSAGRHRYHRLAGADVANALETLARIAPRRTTTANSLRRVRADAALSYARTCYDHLAGTVGVALLDALVGADRLAWEDSSLRFGSDGDGWLTALDIDADRLRSGRRPVLRPCIDWTTRRPHLAGALGAAVTDHALERGWVARRRRGHRALRVTAEGRDAFRDHLGCTLPPPPTA
ncbi:MAG TPA: winged helix-turn-helix domain-containing protein [Nocardioidaceae bacterium]|nr:winged helix-turn-helix domain-containing protein [Nocardioidaceae bacterium]